MRAETRHQLKQDAFSRVTIGAAEDAAHWTVEHRSKVITTAIVVVVVLAAVIGGWNNLSTQDEKASLELSQAVRTKDTQLRPVGLRRNRIFRRLLPPRSVLTRPKSSFRRSWTSIRTHAPATWRTIFWEYDCVGRQRRRGAKL